MSQPVCDFCGTPNVRWIYPTRDFSSDIVEDGAALTFNSSGGWAACPTCHGLIERGERDSLARRSADLYQDQTDVPYPALLASLRALHDDFWANREGSPVASRPDEVTDPTR